MTLILDWLLPIDVNTKCWFVIEEILEVDVKFVWSRLFADFVITGFLIWMKDLNEWLFGKYEIDLTGKEKGRTNGRKSFFWLERRGDQDLNEVLLFIG